MLYNSKTRRQRIPLRSQILGSQEASQPLYFYWTACKQGQSHYIHLIETSNSKKKKKKEKKEKKYQEHSLNCQKEILAWGPVFFPSTAFHKISTVGNYVNLQKDWMYLCTEGQHILIQCNLNGRSDTELIKCHPRCNSKFRIKLSVNIFTRRLSVKVRSQVDNRSLCKRNI